MTNHKDDFIRYRLERAREALDDASGMAERQHWNPCVNRLYYACFYAVNALLIRHGLSSSKHSGVRSLFNYHFVKPDIIPEKLGDFYNNLFDRRRESDYEDFVRMDEATVRPWIDQAKAFVEHIATILEKG